jgi:hypothetical protein
LNAKKKVIEVMAYSGYKANERPTHFFMDHEKRTVEEILDRWYGPDEDYFKIMADDGRLYLLKWSRSLDVWSLENVWEGETPSPA